MIFIIMSAVETNENSWRFNEQQKCIWLIISEELTEMKGKRNCKVKY